jgi:hypothetical protein
MNAEDATRGGPRGFGRPGRGGGVEQATGPGPGRREGGNVAPANAGVGNDGGWGNGSADAARRLALPPPGAPCPGLLARP